jgi:hypothetical protein
MMATATNTKSLHEAITTADREALKVHGWLQIYSALKGVAAKNFDIADLLPYAYILGDLPTEHVLTAIRTSILNGSAGGYRPSPAVIANNLPATASTTGTNLPAPLRPDQQPAALQKAKQLITDGHPICQCVPAANLTRNHGVLTCDGCKGIDQGQADDALEQPE